MATSGSTDFNLVTNEIVQEAFREIGVLTPNRSLTNEEMNDGRRSLNIFAKSLIAKGSFLWKTERATLFLASGQAEYILDGSTANCTESYTETTTSAAASTSDTDIFVTSAAGFVVGYYIGVYQDDNSILWTTIDTIDGTTITLSDALTDDVASGNAVYVYETKLSRPESLETAQIRVSSSDTDLTILSSSTYDSITTKNSSGVSNQIYYDKQLSYGSITLWPVPNTSANTVQITFIKQIFDFDSATDNADFPVEWLTVLIMQVAYRLSRKYGRLSMEEKEQLKRDADLALADAGGYDNEDTSIYFQPASNVNQSNYR